MNFLDILLIILMVMLTLGMLVFVVSCVKDDDASGAFGSFLVWLAFVGILCLISFFAFDMKSGSTTGVITSVDRNTFGQSHAIYIKTTETTEEKYCAESDEVINHAKSLIGKRVRINYGTRVGFYSTGKCHDAPIDLIEEVLE